MTATERAKELNDLLDSARAYATRFHVAVSFETPYAKYFVRADGNWHLVMKGRDLAERGYIKGNDLWENGH
jgi:hypothetical protein